MPGTDKLAAAPISWGVSEVSGWGYQLPAARVLAEMRLLGFTATEAGPDGFLPADGIELRSELQTAQLALVGGFTPLVLHDPAIGWRSALGVAITRLATAGADTLVISADTGAGNYDNRPQLDEQGWARLLSALDEVTARCRDAGLTPALHPHVGTLVESPQEIARVVDGSAVPLCLDTGHVVVGGADPVALARNVPDRIEHVHVKDVDSAVAAKVRGGRMTFGDGVAAQMFQPLGDGDLDIPAIVAALGDAGYAGWYVLEQDVMLTGAPADGAGPVTGIARSRDYLAALLATSIEGDDLRSRNDIP